MRNDRVAEWLLASVAARERAASILGDLRESAATRGELWFWTNVLRTAASLSWRGVADDPRGMLTIAFRAWLLSLGLSVLVVVIGVLCMGVFIGATAMRNSLGVNAAAGGFGAVEWLCLFTGLMSLCQFAVGRWIGRRAPGREMSACLAFTMVQCAIEYPFVLLTMEAQGVALGLFLNLLTHVFCFLGAISVRRRSTNA
jgi:hypothetical protein